MPVHLCSLPLRRLMLLSLLGRRQAAGSSYSVSNSSFEKLWYWYGEQTCLKWWSQPRTWWPNSSQIFSSRAAAAPISLRSSSPLKVRIENHKQKTLSKKIKISNQNRDESKRVIRNIVMEKRHRKVILPEVFTSCFSKLPFRRIIPYRTEEIVKYLSTIINIIIIFVTWNHRYSLGKSVSTRTVGQCLNVYTCFSNFDKFER